MDRIALIHGLLMNEETANEAFISGNMDPDSWAEELKNIDAKLSVVGVRLGFRPWEGEVTIPSRKTF